MTNAYPVGDTGASISERGRHLFFLLARRLKDLGHKGSLVAIHQELEHRFVTSGLQPCGADVQTLFPDHDGVVAAAFSELHAITNGQKIASMSKELRTLINKAAGCRYGTLLDGVHALIFRELENMIAERALEESSSASEIHRRLKLIATQLFDDYRHEAHRRHRVAAAIRRAATRSSRRAPPPPS